MSTATEVIRNEWLWGKIEYRNAHAIDKKGTTTTMKEANDPYSDIRPYRDDEVARVLYRLRAERGLINTLAQWKLGPLYRVVP